MNLLHVFEQGDAVLIATFVLLIAMSAASWYVIFWKSWTLRAERARLQRFRAQTTGTHWARQTPLPQAQGAVALLMARCESLRPQLLGHEAAERKELLSMHLAQALDTIRTGFDRGLTILASVGSIAPFIGLFGTVWGIYGALTDIAAAGNASLTVVAGPMGEALVATAIGLFAAIPAVTAYNAFVRANKLLIQDHRHIAEQLVSELARDRESGLAEITKRAAGGI